ncbi:FAD-linked oxidoreductase [Cercospora beticola]|uniref:FAD-linked oxidoreductase n=1 Tax=Cercospora beticola TaxID=122368 RepID=A0A2G5HBN8_CERBT|nr:FAD-linked oxidoreductase [Cercospora beticola]PIA89652.1 FAD-linked oxidoreductase [Cercospora beticola]WPB03276.1 hypothetical protein RHO25_007913 [Cercospora beticola]
MASHQPRLRSLIPTALALLASFGGTSAASITRRQYQDDLRPCIYSTQVVAEWPDQGAQITTKSQNTNYHYTPLVVVQPTSPEQVAGVIKCVAQRNGQVKASTFGGGHGYASYALGGADGFVVIDSSRLAGISVDKDSKTAHVYMGAKLGPLAIAIGQEGFGLPHGTCPSVGVFGHALGGGWGFSSRNWGWLLDHIVGMTLVDPTGAIRKLSVTSTGQDADLWWALRGAGANNFGVVTDMTLKLEVAPTQAVNWNTTFPTHDECATVLRAVTALANAMGPNQLPKELGFQLLGYGVGGEGVGACKLAGQYLGPIGEFRRAEKVIRDDLHASGVQTTDFNAVEFPGWVEALTSLMGGNLNSPPVQVPYYAQSLIDDGSPSYSVSGSQAIFQAVQETVNTPNEGTSISFDLNGPFARTNGEQPYGDSSFAVGGHRGSTFMSQIYVNGYPAFDNMTAQTPVNAAVDNLNAAVRANDPNGNWKAYVNYIDPRLQNWAQMYYGDALQRLKDIKKQVDPNTIFDYPQGLAHA